MGSSGSSSRSRGFAWRRGVPGISTPGLQGPPSPKSACGEAFQGRFSAHNVKAVAFGNFEA